MEKGEKTMPLALSVAKELARLSLSGEEPDPLTNLRLQKLLYYAQAWSLIVRGSDLFPETIEAWRHGPVVPVVYHYCKAKEQDFEGIPDVPAPVREFLARFWEAYKGYSATALYQKTHKETPWIKAWGDRPADGSGNDPIDSVVMGDFFGAQPMPEPIAAYERMEEQKETTAKAQLEAMPPIDRIKFRERAVSFSGSFKK